MTSLAVNRIAPIAPLPAGSQLPAVETSRTRAGQCFAVNPAIQGEDPSQQAGVAAAGDQAQRAARPVHNDRLPRHQSDQAGPSSTPTQQPDNVVYLYPEAEPSRDPRLAGFGLPSAPFIAQQLAQQSDNVVPDDRPAPRHAAAANTAYRLAGGYPEWVLGPVRPANLIV